MLPRVPVEVAKDKLSTAIYNMYGIYEEANASPDYELRRTRLTARLTRKMRYLIRLHLL